MTTTASTSTSTSTATFTIDEALCSRVLEVVDKGLTQGLGTPKPGKMCVEAAVNYALGLPHGDNPSCVGTAVRAFKIRLNDSHWSSDEARARGMRKLAIAQLGSDQIDQLEFSTYVVIETIRQILPLALEKVGLTKEAEECRQVTDIKNAHEVTYAANAAARTVSGARAANSTAYAVAAAHDAYYAAAFYAADAPYPAVGATEAASYTAYACAAAVYNAVDAVAYAATVDDRSKILQLSAQIGLDALIKLKSPGCKFLYLCDYVT